MSNINPLNNVTLVGSLMTDPTSHAENHARVLLSVQRPGHSGHTNIQLVDWNDDWGSTKESPKSREGDHLKDFAEGDRVLVEGELLTRAFQPKGSEQSVYRTEVQVRHIESIEQEDYTTLIREATVQALS